MIVTTTFSVECRAIRDYLGIVTGEVIMGANVFRDIRASITDIVGGRSQAYEEEMVRGRQNAIDEMIAKADELRADAIVGVDLAYAAVREGMMMIAATGTVVRLE